MVTPPITTLLLSLPHVWMTEQSNSSRENKQSTRVVLSWSSPFKIFEIYKQQQQASRANMMHNMDVLIKLSCIISENRISIIYKIAFVWISPPGVYMKFIIHIHVKKNSLILVRVLYSYQTFFFFTWNFINRLKQTFLQTTSSLLADKEPIKIQRRLIDLSKTEKRVRS